MAHEHTHASCRDDTWLNPRLITPSSYPYVNVETVALGWSPWDGHRSSLNPLFPRQNTKDSCHSPPLLLLLFIALTTIDTQSGVMITDQDSIPRVSLFISYSVKIIYKTNSSSSCSSKGYIYISIRGTDIIFSITNWMTSTNKLPVTWNCPRLDYDVGMTDTRIFFVNVLRGGEWCVS